MYHSLRMIASCGALMLSSALLVSAQCQFTSELNSPNAALAPYLPTSGSFGTVCINVTNGDATVTFTAASGFLFGGHGAVDLNLSTDNFTVTNISQPELSVGNAGNVDGQGTFNLVMNNFDGAAHAFSSVTFTINDAFTDAASVLTANNLGLDAAAHIFVCADATCTSFAAITTGFAGENPNGGGGGGGAPEPSSIVLFGGVMLFAVSRFRKYRQAA